MSVPNKSSEKNKRFVGVKPNDFVNKTRPNDVNRSNVRPQGWANLGKVNSRRIPPPANVPSLKSEIGCQPPAYDPTVSVNHGWSSTTPSNDVAPTQQQLDALPIHSSAPATPTVSAPNSADVDKSRLPPSWSNVTSASTNNIESIPNLLALNDFPRLATVQEQHRSSPNEQNPTFRPANLSTWKEGGGGTNPNRIPSLMSDLPVQLMSPNQSNRNYSNSPMWAYPNHQSSRLSNVTDYKSPRILRHKDIDELSKLTDNTWANATEEINYEEKIRFSDDEEAADAAVPLNTSSIETSLKPRRIAHPLSHSRFIQDDEHLKQMQDNKNSELINALTIAKQRRDEQERHLMKKSHDDQENVENSTIETNKASRTRHDTANSQTFSMKSWSDQMDSFNYASLHEKSTMNAEQDEVPVSIEFHRSASESSSPSRQESNSQQTKPRKIKTRLIQSKQYQQTYENSSPRNDSNEQSTRRTNSKKTTGHPEQAIYRVKQSSMKTRNPDRSQPNSLQKMNNASQLRQDSTDVKGKSNRNDQVWRPVSPPRSAPDSNEAMPQESNTYKSQTRSNTTEHKTRYPISSTAHIDTSSIPPLMSVCSDPAATAHLFKTNVSTSNSTHYSQRQEFYHENQHEQSHQRYPHVNRGYPALGSYGRYRRGGVTPTTNRPASHQEDYSVYPSVGQPKKNGHRKSTEFAKALIDDGVISPLMSKSIESPLTDLPIEPMNNRMDQQDLNPNDSNENQSKTKVGNGSNGKRRSNREPLTFYQAQQAPRHRNNYPRGTQDYESLPTQHYYNNSRRNPTMQDASSSGYYYEHPQQKNYKNQYNNFPSETSHSVRVQSKKQSKRGGSATTAATTTLTHRHVKTRLNNGNHSNTNHHRHHSTSDNDPKEGEEWETASESSTNMRNGHPDNHPHSSTTATATNHRGRTPPKKTFSSQRQHARQIFKYTNA